MALVPNTCCVPLIFCMLLMTDASVDAHRAFQSFRWYLPRQILDQA